MSTEYLSGQITRMQSGFYSVETPKGIFQCQLRGRLKKIRIMEDIAAVGDKVKISLINEETGTIEEIIPRERALVRLAPTARGDFKQVLLANLDLIVFVFACAQPDPSLRMLDRFLVISEKQEIPSLIIANKVDLVGIDQAKNLFSIFEDIDYKVVYTSTKTGEGIEELEQILEGKLSAFAGPSGVGKTSLLNVIKPGLGLDVRSVKLTSAKKGRHTTTVRELFSINENTKIADLPGLRQLAIWDIEPEELDGYYREFRNFIPDCQFSDCRHNQESNCAIKEAVNKGRISEERYDSYLRLRNEIESSQKFQ